MPKIYLKPNSAEYADENKERPQSHICEMPGCHKHAEHKAPKNRDLSGYYFFCLEHVQEYNKAWDFFSGMSASEIEDHIIKSALWDRDTKRFDNYRDLEEELRRKTRKWRDDKTDKKQDQKTEYRYIDKNTPEFEAMAIMGLEPPLDLDVIKKRYKDLAKKYHPDINRDNPQAEELLKRINMAYTILKLAHEKFAIFEDAKQ